MSDRLSLTRLIVGRLAERALSWASAGPHGEEPPGSNQWSPADGPPPQWVDLVRDRAPHLLESATTGSTSGDPPPVHGDRLPVSGGHGPAGPGPVRRKGSSSVIRPALRRSIGRLVPARLTADRPRPRPERHDYELPAPHTSSRLEATPKPSTPSPRVTSARIPEPSQPQVLRSGRPMRLRAITPRGAAVSRDDERHDWGARPGPALRRAPALPPIRFTRATPVTVRAEPGAAPRVPVTHRSSVEPVPVAACTAPTAVDTPLASNRTSKPLPAVDYLDTPPARPRGARPAGDERVDTYDAAPVPKRTERTQRRNTRPLPNRYAEMTSAAERVPTSVSPRTASATATATATATGEWTPLLEPAAPVVVNTAFAERRRTEHEEL